MKEIWKDIKDFKGLYQVSNLGRIRSLDRYVNHRIKNKKAFRKGIILKPTPDKVGYYRVNLKNGNYKKTLKIHRLVCIYFLDNPNNYEQVNHKDGNKKNNNITNLEWCDSYHNNKHARDLGLNKLYGENNGQSILTEKEVIQIKKLLKRGKNQKEISKLFKVAQSTISAIFNKKTWSYL